MQVSYLREFVELSYRHNFSETARALHTTQSTISKHVMALEKECGAQLFKRAGAHVELTEEGRTLFEGALKVIEAHDRTLERIAALKKSPSITVGGLYRNVHTLQFIANIVRKRRQEGNPLSVSYRNVHHRPFCALVQSGELDVAFTVLERDTVLSDGLMSLHLFDDPLVAIVMEDHPLAQKERLSLQDIDKQSLLSPDGAYAIAGAALVHNLFAKHGVTPEYQPVYLQSVQDFPTLDIDDNVLILEESIQRQQPLTDAFRVLPFVEEEACFPIHAVYRAKDGRGEIGRFIEELAIESEAYRQKISNP